MPVDREQLKQIAFLAQLRIEDDETAGYLDDLNGILALVDQLSAVDTDGVEPLSNPLDQTQRLRPDTPTESDQREALMRGAPETADGLFLVPRVIE